MDGFMIWRCLVLYRDISRLRHLTLSMVSLFLGTVSLVSGILFIVPWFSPYNIHAHIPAWKFVIAPLTLFASATISINIVFTTLISIRLWRHQSRLKKLLGPGHRSVYRRIVIILLESAALVVVMLF
ncbi:hypothetical protein BJ165DRAFT_1134203 [Panaeolus papilionaceus]|nr:hypothetical protein BJ165DRAFT_1134203 [Panaeolus papilionaceus]